MNKKTFPIRDFFTSRLQKNFFELCFPHEACEWVTAQISSNRYHWMFNVSPWFWPFESWKTNPHIGTFWLVFWAVWGRPPFLPLILSAFRVHYSCSYFRHLLFWRRCRRWISACVVAVDIPSSGREATGGPDICRVHFHIQSPFRPSSLDRFTSFLLFFRRFSAKWSALKQTMFRLHHVFIRAQIIQRNESQMERQVKLLKAVCQCSARFVSGSIVWVPECVRALLRQTRCSDDLLLARIYLNTVLAFRSRAIFLHASMISSLCRLGMITGLKKPWASKCRSISFVSSS